MSKLLRLINSIEELREKLNGLSEDFKEATEATENLAIALYELVKEDEERNNTIRARYHRAVHTPSGKGIKEEYHLIKSPESPWPITDECYIRICQAVNEEPYKLNVTEVYKPYKENASGNPNKRTIILIGDMI